jgi:bla regulator protein BlaR1
MIDHLWQSTLCAAAAALAALALGRAPAHVRYRIWLAASVKFLIPFAALTALGRQFAWRTVAANGLADPPSAAATLDLLAQPFSSDALVGAVATVAASGSGSVLALAPWVAGSVWLSGSLAVAVTWLARWRRVARAVAAATHVDDGRELQILRRLEARAGSTRPIAIRLSSGTLEPGVFGVRRPVLLWPASISARLTDSQIEAILAHELAHVRRHDNITAALHMVVQAAFWFHPLVWWLGARLVDERERACDQDVLRAGAEPDDYAEGILRTVRSYVESPLVCVAGVTGSDLKRRIEDIMQNRTGVSLPTWQRGLLAAAGVTALAVPIAIGTLSVRVVAAQVPANPAPALAFESASVKRNNSAEGRVSMRIMPGGVYEALNVTVRAMIQQAWQMQEFQVVGGPDWLATQRIDILAKSPEGAAPADLMPRIRTLLEERFKLKVKRDTRDAPIYALVLARGDKQLGPSIKPNPVECAPPAGRAGMPPPGSGAGGSAPAGRVGMPPPGTGPGGGAPAPGIVPMQMTMELGPLGTRMCGNLNSGGKVMAGGQTMAQIAQTLQRQTGRIVQDRTGLTGRFDFDLQFTPDPQLAGRGPGGGLPANIENPRPVDPNAISIFSAVQEQLGLRLESTRGPVDALVIESAEPLVEN